MIRRGAQAALAIFLTLLVLSGSACSLLIELLKDDPTPTPTPVPAPTTRPVTPSPAPVSNAALVTGKIETGNSVQIATQSINLSGGTLTVTAAGSPLDGLTLTVPPSSYPAAKTFRISSAPVNRITFPNVTPITPLITIDNGGEFSNQPLTVKIPVQVPAGQFAMGFYYDRQKGRLEGIPTVAVDAGSITLSTCHFCDLLVLTTADIPLEGDCDSSFRGAANGWQFGNHRLAPIEGYCAGWCSSAIWYYIEKPDGNAPLFNHIEGTMGHSTPGIGPCYDDVKGIRLASSIQMDYEDRGTWLENLTLKFAGISPKMSAKYMAFSILATGAPQLGVVTYPNDTRHAVIIPRVDKLVPYIVDPNFPGEDWKAAWENDQLYYTDKEKDKGTLTFMAVSAFASWDQIGKRWNELKGGTIGNDRYPNYRLIAYAPDKTGTYVPLYDRNGQKLEITPNWQFPATVNEIKIVPELPAGAANPAWVIGPKFELEARVSNKDFGWSNGLEKIYRGELKPGSNLYGIYVRASAPTKYDPGLYQTGWLDYRYVTVNLYSQLSITPAQYTGKPGESVTFVVSDPALPAGATFEWSLDGKVVKTGSDTSYTFKIGEDDTYGIAVRELDRNGSQLAAVSARVTVAKPVPATGFNWTAARKTNLMFVKIGPGQHTYRDQQVGKTTTGTLTKSGNAYIPCADNLWEAASDLIRITWNGTSFNGTQNWKDAAGATLTATLAGKLSDDGKTLLSLTYQEKYSSSHGGNVDNNFQSGFISGNGSIQLANVPLTWITDWEDTPGEPRKFTSTFAGGTGVSKYVKITDEIDDTLGSMATKMTPWEWITYQSSSWDSKAVIEVQLYQSKA